MKTTTQRILSKMFDSTLPAGSISLSKYGEIEVVISTYHALEKTLSFDKRLDQKLKRYIAKNDAKQHWKEVAEFAAHDEARFIQSVSEDNLFSEEFMAVVLHEKGSDDIVLLKAGDYYFYAEQLRAFVGSLPSALTLVRCVNGHEWEGYYLLHPMFQPLDRRHLQKLPVFDLRARTLWLDGHETELSTLTLAQAVAIQTGSRHVSGIITVDGDDVMCPVCGAKLYAGTY